jgi:hypothetical protein
MRLNIIGSNQLNATTRFNERYGNEIEELAVSILFEMFERVRVGDYYGAKESFKSIDGEKDRFVAKIAMQKIAVHMFANGAGTGRTNGVFIHDFFDDQNKLESFRLEILGLMFDWVKREEGRISPSLRPKFIPIQDNEDSQISKEAAEYIPS